MTIGAFSNPSIVPPQQEVVPDTSEQLPLPEAYDAIRNDPAIQFEPLKPKALEPVEPSWLEQVLTDMFGWLAQLFAPLAQLIVGVWPVLQWVLLAALIGFVQMAFAALFGGIAIRFYDGTSLTLTVTTIFCACMGLVFFLLVLRATKDRPAFTE